MSYLENLIMLMDNAGDKEIIVVCDFDGTITTSDSDVTMSAMAKIAGYDSDFSKARTALYNEYGRYLTPSDNEEERYKMLEKWWKQQMELFKKYNFPPESYTEAIKKLKITLRDGMPELLSYCEKNDIPVFIVSAGLGNLIIPILAFSGNLSMNMRVLSNFVRYDGDKAVSYTPVVTPMNKRAHLSLELGAFDSFHALVFGDNASDLDIFPDDICTKVKI